jgi:hypothetical protein
MVPGTVARMYHPNTEILLSKIIFRLFNRIGQRFIGPLYQILGGEMAHSRGEMTHSGGEMAQLKRRRGDSVVVHLTEKQ